MKSIKKEKEIITQLIKPFEILMRHLRSDNTEKNKNARQTAKTKNETTENEPE